MKLKEFPPRTKVHRPGWRTGLFCVRNMQNVWVYIENGLIAGRLSTAMIKNDDFEYYEKETKMEDVNFVGGEYNVVKALRMNSSEIGYYKVSVDLPIEENQKVVVHSPRGYILAIVKQAYQNTFENADTISKAKAWVVDTVDDSDHQARIKATIKRQYLIEQLEERRQALEATRVYEMLGSIDPKAKKLLKELKKLS